MKETTYYYIKYWETLGILAVKTEFEPGESGYIHVRGDIDAQEFELRFGVAPELDDLDRVNCSEAGNVGHWQCGVCTKHSVPRSTCGCRAPDDEPARLKAIDPSTLTVTVEKY